MRNFDIRELQLKEMELILELDRICKKYDIRYYMSWGSALGAVRHKGFIPWDDDIDVSMFWDDYIKFEQVCKIELNNKFFYQNDKNDEQFWLSWNKIRINNTTSMCPELKNIKCHWGVCMDIFPIIPVPDSLRDQKIQEFNVKIYKFLCNKYFLINSKDVSIKNKIKKCIYKIMPNRIISFLKKIALKNITKYNQEDYQMCGEILSMPYKEAIIKKELFGEPIYVEFENYLLPIPKEYDKYLSQCYGDYMKLPPENERTGHGDIIVDLERSFERYI
ncbi:LicD family protein [Romboutsia lituseburensis]|uniref:LicD family protein n=1 Tax=Romboutsia lituseburensis TaxID=1537 RepID=UPI0022EA6FE7|nr:LicD family protein [Romboutsia lituseburensis]